MDVWFALHADIQGAYKASPANTGLIERIWQFAAWCFEPGRHKSVRNAAAVAFYEHLPHVGPARRELPRRLDRRAFLELLPAFRSTLADPEYEAFVKEFLTAQGADRETVKAALADAT